MTSPPPADHQPALLRHIVPVVAGGLVTVLLTVVTDNTLSAHQVLPAAADRPVPATGSLLLAAAYRGLFAILGCHMAARLAPADQPRIRYALALGALMLVVNIIGAVSLWGQVPPWYSLSGIALTIPYAIIGGGTAARLMARN